MKVLKNSLALLLLPLLLLSSGCSTWIPLKTIEIKTVDVDRVTIVGTAAGSANMTAAADGTVAVGYNSLNANTQGERNTAIGYDSLSDNTTGVGNTVIGWKAGDSITTGTN